MCLLGPKKCSAYSLGVLNVNTLRAKLFMSPGHLDDTPHSWVLDTLNEVGPRAGFLRLVTLGGHT